MESIAPTKTGKADRNIKQKAIQIKLIKATCENNAKAKKMIPKDPSENGGKKKLTISGNYYWSDRHNCWVLEE